MSLNSALLAGTSGLIANSGALAAISDNIANVNTAGYKRTVTTFNPQVKANPSSVSYTAGSVQAITRQAVIEQGIVTSSNNSTDLAISGQGFFTVTSLPENQGPGDSYLFTRAGRFAPDEEGFLVNDAGYYLQGWPVEADGTVDANPSDLTALESINVSAIGGTAEATSRLQFNANLDSLTPYTAPAAAYAAGDMANAINAVAGNQRAPDFQTSVQVFDSLGNLRTFTFAFAKEDPTVAPNNWALEIIASPANQVDVANGLVWSGTVQFTSDGQVDFGNSTFSNVNATSGLPELNLGASGAGVSPRWADTAGVSASVIQLDLGGSASTGGLTQLRSQTTVLSAPVNGSTFGDLAGVEVDQNGFLVARFNNGVVREVYQLPIATFPNPNGLSPDTGAAYRVSKESGSFTLKQPGVGGAGLISSRALESSNVDLATEFTGLITTQRAYSAASKIITTTDEMMEELIRMKR